MMELAGNKLFRNYISLLPLTLTNPKSAGNYNTVSFFCGEVFVPSSSLQDLQKLQGQRLSHPSSIPPH